MSLKILFAIFIFTYSTHITFAQRGLDYPKQQVGIGWSTISGAGISYQMEFSRNWAAQVNGFAYYLSDDSENIDYYINAGLEFQYNLLYEYNKRIYTFAGLSRWYIEQRKRTEYYIGDIKYVVQENIINRIDNFGFGLGYEYLFVEQASINFTLGLQYQISPETNLKKYIDRNQDGKKFLGIGGGITLRYVF